MGKKTKNKTDRQAAQEATPEEHLAELEARCAELEAQALRASADYQNLRRRSLTDQELGLKRSMQPLLEELLFVLDFLDMALASPAEHQETVNLLMGVQMTRTRFAAALENSDVEEIPTDGVFDPTVHDATDTRVEERAEPGTILSTTRKGYTWQGRVLRPAQVVVAADAGAAEEAERAGPEGSEQSGEA